MTDRRHALYRMYDHDGQLVYVGISLNPTRRFAEHRGDKAWWEQVETFTMQTYPSRAAALAAESHAIRTEQPLFNVAQNRDPGQPHPPTVAQSEPVESADDEGRVTAPDDMGDCCHDHCVKTGDWSIYLPYQWAGGLALYRCRRGHTWTCSWDNDDRGRDPRYDGRPVQVIELGPPA